jgi:hypothetical protein
MSAHSFRLGDVRRLIARERPLSGKRQPAAGQIVTCLEPQGIETLRWARQASSGHIGMMQNPSFRSRILGSLYGLAVGDALGAPYEFTVRGKYTVTSEMEESHIFTYKGNPLPAGTWTDDTSMALCLGKSLAEKGQLDWRDVANKWVQWYRNGYMSAIGYCFDIGLSSFSPH